MLGQAKHSLAIRSLERTRDRQRAFEYMPPLAAPFLSLPGLAGLWGAMSIDQANNLYDLSGQGRTLTATGTTALGTVNGLAGYMTLDGSTTFWSRADEAGLDLTGALSILAWVYFTNAASAQEVILSKGNGAAAGTAYWLNRQATGEARGLVSTGAAFVSAIGTSVLAASTWYLVGMRYDPTVDVVCFVNGRAETTTTASVPASTVNSANQLVIGNYDAGALDMAGRVAVAALCRAALRESLVSSVYQQTRGWFGV